MNPRFVAGLTGLVIGLPVSPSVAGLAFIIAVQFMGTVLALCLAATLVIATLAFAIMTSWARMTSVRRRGSRGLVMFYAIAGALSAAIGMIALTLVLGHTRPMWMEFNYAPISALFGAVVGALMGLLVNLSIPNTRSAK